MGNIESCNIVYGNTFRPYCLFTDYILNLSCSSLGRFSKKQTSGICKAEARFTDILLKFCLKIICLKIVVRWVVNRAPGVTIDPIPFQSPNQPHQSTELKAKPNL